VFKIPNNLLHSEGFMVVKMKVGLFSTMNVAKVIKVVGIQNGVDD